MTFDRSTEMTRTRKAAAGDRPIGRDRGSWFLRTGHIFASDKPHIVHTVLGSCVSVCLWDPLRRAGGINHFRQPSGESHSDFLVGPKAIRHLIQRMCVLGCQQRHLQALLFGGAHVLEGFDGLRDIGAQNLAVAEHTLDESRIAIVYRHVGGSRGRKLFFRTDTGGYGVKLLPNRSDVRTRRPAASSEAGRE